MSFPDERVLQLHAERERQAGPLRVDAEDYSTDVLAAKTLNFIDGPNGTTPFFAYLATALPHDSYQQPRATRMQFKNEPIPHSPAFNEADMSDKPSWWRHLAPRKTRDIDNARRKEYASLLAVDDAVKSIFQTP